MTFPVERVSQMKSASSYSTKGSNLLSPEDVHAIREPMSRYGDEDRDSEEKEPDQPAGYDLEGLAGPGQPHPMGRATRQEIPLDTHEGLELRGSDYDQAGEKGFRFRVRFDRV